MVEENINALVEGISKEETILKKNILMLILVMALLMSGSAVSFAKTGGTIRIGIGSDATSLDPRYVTSTAGMYISSQIFDGLIELNKDIQFEPGLATYENPEPTLYVFHLEEGVKYHDGHELTAEDVKYTFESVLNPENASPKSGNYKQIVGAEEFISGEADEVVGIKIIDDYTVSFELKEPFAPFLVNMNLGIVPKHIAEKAGKDFADNPVGTGPFKFVSRIIEQETVLEANDEYFEGRPNIDKVVYRPLPESAVGVIELETGNIDVLMSITEDDLVNIENNSDLVLASASGTNYQYIGFNVTNEPVDNKYLRKAIAYALDKQAITDYFEGVRTYVPLPGGHYLAKEMAKSSAINKYEYSLNNAKAMLSKAGLAGGADVVIKTSSGRKELAEIMKEMLAEANINAEIELLEWGTFYKDVKEGQAQIYLLGWYGIIDPDGYWFFHSEMTPPKGGANRMYYSNPKVDTLIEKGRASLDPKMREIYTKETYKLLTDDVPMIFLYSKPDLAAYRKGIVGFEPAPYPVTILANLKDVYFED
ncbi:MAG: ABC transporter substrate-binding protein [Halanaerobiales bacterium]|nr:ABC transporter substrate-binding protein [Halanaerobiales bacterium]